MEWNTNLSKCNIILGSKSPRRKDILKKMGIKFTVQKIDFEENTDFSKSIKDVAQSISRLKSNSFNKLKKNDILICADTIVSIEEKKFGKPSSKKEAFYMLKQLSGKNHQVTTGVTIKNIYKKRTFFDTTIVSFKKLNDYEINYYIEYYNPIDKAGAYAIQEWIGLVAIKKIEGSYFNVVGLPSEKLYSELIRFVNEKN